MTLQADPAAAPTRRPAHGPAALEGVPLERVNAPGTFFGGFVVTARQIWEYRGLLNQLIRKELKVKYKGSVLGFFWSFLRPLCLLLVYYIAIGKFLKSPIPDFVVFLFSGLVAWTLFADVVGAATTSIVGNAGLIKKIYFPREILPLAVVGAALVQFVLQLVVLFGAVLLTGRRLRIEPIVTILPASLVALVLFMTGVALLVAAANVYLRDTQHLIEVVLLFWFWMTPVVYAIGTVETKIAGLSHWLLTLYLANPMAIVVLGFQRAVYQSGTFAGHPLLFTGHILGRELLLVVVGVGFVWLSQRIFARAQGNFAQEL